MTKIRVMAVFQGGSGLPEDRFINTYHFYDPTGVDYDGDAEDARARVRSFYEDTEGSADPFGLYMSPYVNRAYSVVSYNLALPEGERVPTAESGTLPTGGSEGLPEEVAIVLTLRGAPPVTPRRRGRLYFGPLVNQSTIVDYGDTTTPARVELSGASNVGDCLLVHASNLAVASFPLRWCIRSTTPSENFVPIESGYVDDAFDTQRRRGPDPTTRNFFVAL